MDANGGGKRQIQGFTEEVVQRRTTGAFNCHLWQQIQGLLRIHREEELNFCDDSRMEDKFLGWPRFEMGTEVQNPRLYYADSLGASFGVNDKDFIATGSGAIHTKSILEQGYNNHLTISVALEFARKIMYEAASNDSYIGGIVIAMHVGKDETSRLWKGDILRHYNAKKEDENSGPIYMEIDDDKDEGTVPIKFKGRKLYDS
ncbi:hypothetical protein K1719_031633 [Acacia pycnantha]|nr:hypothetical protein K1719_031633 [Acacia pycnantha]